MEKWLKKIPAKEPQTDDKIDNASTSEQQENGRADNSIPSMNSLSVTLQGKNSDNLIKSNKNFAKKI